MYTYIKIYIYIYIYIHTYCALERRVLLARCLAYLGSASGTRVLPFRPFPHLTWPIACGNSTWLRHPTLRRLPPNPFALSEAEPGYG